MTQKETPTGIPQVPNQLSVPGAPPIQSVDSGHKNSGISCTPGVCGGSPCIVRSRIPVWVLQRARLAGVSDDVLIERYPSLTLIDLTNAWLYALNHSEEIQHEIRENDAW